MHDPSFILWVLSMLYVDRKYLDLVSHRLSKFKWRSKTIANCRCPICGDSQKNKHKTRGYWYVKNDNYWYYCHNCGVSKSLKSFLFEIDASLHNQYSREVFVEGRGGLTVGLVAPEREFSPEQFKQSSISPYASATRLMGLREGHPARLYAEGRKLPKNRLESLYYVPKFFSWASEWKESYKPVANTKSEHPRLIIPLIDHDGAHIGFSARCFGKEEPKYIMIRFDEFDPVPLKYGFDFVNMDLPIYCTEGPIDSMFVDNCVASCNAALHTVKEADVLIYDNQPRNREVIMNIERGVESGKKVVIWPSSFQYKDINEAVMEGCEDIMDIVRQNTYSGLLLKLKFCEWKMI